MDSIDLPEVVLCWDNLGIIQVLFRAAELPLQPYAGNLTGT